MVSPPISGHFFCVNQYLVKKMGKHICHSFCMPRCWVKHKSYPGSKYTLVKVAYACNKRRWVNMYKLPITVLKDCEYVISTTNTIVQNFPFHFMFSLHQPTKYHLSQDIFGVNHYIAKKDDKHIATVSCAKLFSRAQVITTQ